MRSEGRRPDEQETDLYDVGMFPAPPPQPAEPAQPPPARAVTLGPLSPRPPSAAPYEPPAASWPAGWQAPYDTSALAILSATLMLVLGLLGALLFGGLLAIWDAVARLGVGLFAPLQTIESTRIVILTLLVVSVAQLVAAIGVFAHRSWARWIGVAISVPATVAGTLLVIAALGRGVELQAWLAGAFLAAYAIVFFGLIAGNSHFRRLQRRY